MSELHDPVLGLLQLVDEEDGQGSWEFEFSYRDTTVNGSLRGSSAAPDPGRVDALRAVVQQPELYLNGARRAVRQMLDEHPDLVELEPDDLAHWRALDPDQFASHLSWEWLRFSEAYELVVLGFETDLDAEHGLGVGFRGQTVETVDLRPHLL